MASEDLGDDLDDSWMLNLQEFLDSIEPIIHNYSSSQELSEVLMNLEATDRNFHKYAFIQQIKDKITEELNPMIETVVDGFEQNDDNGFVTDMTENILQTKEFVYMSDVISESVKTAANHITQHLNSETFDFSDVLKPDSKETFYYNVESICSTSDGVDFMFMSPDRYKHLANEIGPEMPAATKASTLTILQQVPQADLVASDSWNLIRKHILTALDDNVEEVNMKALKFLSRLFLSGNSHVVREYLLILLENLINYFSDDTSHMVSLDAGLDLGDRRNVLLLRKFRLLNQIQQELPAHWIRHSDRHIKELTENLFLLLQVVPTPISETVGKNLLDPLHFLSLLDPQATWFKYWWHGHYGRFQVMKTMTSHPEFLRKAVRSCINFPKYINKSSHADNAEGRDEDYVIFDTTDIIYTHFLHSFSIVSKIMLHESGRKLISFAIDGEVVDVKELTNTFVHILKVCPLQSMNISKSLYHPVFMIVDAFRMICDSGQDTVISCICNTDVCRLLLSSFKDCFETMNEGLLNVISEILGGIASTEPGCGELMKPFSNATEFSNSPAIFAVVSALEKILDDNNHEYSNSLVTSIVSLCSKIYCTPIGVIAFENFNVAQKIFDLSSLLTGNNTNVNKSGDRSSADERLEKQRRDLLDNLLSFAFTPKGVNILVETGGFDIVIANMFENREGLLQKLSKYDYESLLNQIATTEAGVVALEKVGYVGNILRKIWSHLEGSVNDYQETALSDFQEDLSSRISRKFFIHIIKLLSSFYSVVELFGKTVIPSVGESITDDGHKHTLSTLRTFYDFMQFSILINSDKKGRLLYHLHQTHLFGLNVLSTVIACLDSLLYLQANFNFQDVLLSLQTDCHRGRNDYILDPCSIKRNEILVKTYLLGGSNEKIIPLDTLAEDTMFPYPWPLFTTYPVPDSYITRTYKSAVDQQKDVHSRLTSFTNKITQGGDDEEVVTKAFAQLQEFYLTDMCGKHFKNFNHVIVELLQLGVSRIAQDDFLQIPLTKKKEKKVKGQKMTTLSDADELGIDLVVRYGIQLRLIHSKSEAVESLRSLICEIREHVHTSLSNGFVGFDWFIGLMFILFQHCGQEALPFLKDFASTIHSVYLWLPRMNTTKVHPILTKTCHYVELILRNELPEVFAAFRLSSFPPSQICQHWLRQCFLNYLDWPDIIWYICTCVIMGLDYQIYFTVSIFKHLQNEILRHTQDDDLVVFLKNSPVKQFYPNEHVTFMTKLSVKYREMVMEDLRNLQDSRI